MPEIKNNFIKSKMNKDLDARILPNGEYRDAENIMISRSEGSDVGALENIKGNELLNNFGLSAGIECIGQYTDSLLNRIYLFFTDWDDENNIATAGSYHSIICYYYETNTFDVLVDGYFLNFSKTNFIYGVNLLEDLLFWTDNRNQPRKINVERAISAPATSPTPYYSIEETISVAKYYPFDPISFNTEIEIEVSVVTSSLTSNGKQSIITIDPASLPLVENITLHPGLQFYIKNVANLDTPEFPYFHQIKRFPELSFLTSGLNPSVWSSNYNLTRTPANPGGYYDNTFAYNIGDFTTYLDGKIYKAIAASTGFPPPDLTYWEEVPDTLDRTKFETALPITVNNGTDYTGTATLVLVYPEITDATKQFLPTSYRLRINSIFDPSSGVTTGPTLIESQGITGGVQLPVTNNYLGTPQIIAAPTKEIQKSIADLVFEVSLSGENPPNGWGLGTDLAGSGTLEQREFLQYFIFPGMRVTSPLLTGDEIFIIDQTFPNGFRSPGSFEFTIKRINRDGTPVDEWSTFFDWDPSTGTPNPLHLNVHYPNPFYQYPFEGDENYLKDKFTRLSYRYKFDDGEYSLIAPFTQAVFIPKNNGYFVDDDKWWDNRVLGPFSRNTGYVTGQNPLDINDRNELSKSNINRLMENSINKINLDIPMPYINGQQLQVQDLKETLKVEKIEILIKEDNETNIRLIESIDTDDLSITSNTENSYDYLYNGQKPIKVLPEKEVTRVYDKVPIKALAQEISGNRVIYGNYVDKHTSPINLDFSVGVSRKFKVNEINSEQCAVDYPNHTVKQNRTYRVGIVLADKFGRQSDVITGPVVPESYVLNNIQFEGDTINSKYLTFEQAASPLEDLKYPLNFVPPPTYIYPLQADIEAGSNIVDWVGETIKLVFNEAIPTSGAQGYPGVYDKDTNPLGWYSYKVVIKQQEHEYYNVYLNGITNGNIFLDPAAANGSPIDYNNISMFSLIGDNLNKITINYSNFDLGNDVKYFTSDVLLYPRVSCFGGIDIETPFVSTPFGPDFNSIYVAQVFNGEQYEKILSLGQLTNIVSATTPYPEYLYQGNSDPFIVQMTNDADIGINLNDVNDFTVGFENSGVLEGHTIYIATVIETSPIKSNLDIFWETTTSGLVNDIVVDDIVEVKYFNTFWNKNINTGITDLNNSNIPAIPGRDTKTWPGPVSYFDALTGTQLQNSNDPGGSIPDSNQYLYRNYSEAVALQRNWYIEESRIFGGFNNDIVGLGVRAYLNEEESIQERRASSLIYSGIYNSRTGTNETNVFSVGEDITRSLDPANGSIQKLYAEDTNLIIFQEDKVNKALIDKDAIYSAEGNAAVTSTNLVIGQIIPYLGEFGISTNPESFAIFGFSKYFVDRQKGSVLRLSRDGITEISEYGMTDFFRDELATLNNSNDARIVGGWDVRAKQYVVSIQDQNGVDYQTLGFDERINGWVSRFDYKPSIIFSLNNDFLSFQNGDYAIYKHYSDNVNRCNFYGVDNKASMVFIMNANPSLMKNFNTINYEGSNGWEVGFMNSGDTGSDLVNGSWVLNQDSTAIVKSYDEGKYNDGGVIYRSGFNRKENRYVANLINNSTVKPEEILDPIGFGDVMSGIKGYFATVAIQTDDTTDPGGFKELFAVGSNIVMSSR